MSDHRNIRHPIWISLLCLMYACFCFTRTISAWAQWDFLFNLSFSNILLLYLGISGIFWGSIALWFSWRGMKNAGKKALGFYFLWVVSFFFEKLMVFLVSGEVQQNIAFLFVAIGIFSVCLILIYRSTNLQSYFNRSRYHKYMCGVDVSNPLNNCIKEKK